MPTVNYKGGAPGFVQIPDPKRIVFPNYDGNGMFLSMANAEQTAKVGLLFMDFETPHLVRVQGTASVSHEATDIARFPGANMVVTMAVESCFLNCGRYIHKHLRVETSKYVPDANGKQPFPAWKRIDVVQPALREIDMGVAEREGGTITLDEYKQKVVEGDQ